MPEDATPSSVRFEPLDPAPRRSLIAGVVLGPLLWLVALSITAWALEYSWAIAVGLLVTVASFLVALVVLVLLRAARVRQEQEHVDNS